MAIKITASREAPPHPGGSYRHYIAGNVYDATSDPPATPDLEARALGEGWAILWPPSEQLTDPRSGAIEGPAESLSPQAPPASPSGTVAGANETLGAAPPPPGSVTMLRAQAPPSRREQKSAGRDARGRFLKKAK